MDHLERSRCASGDVDSGSAVAEERPHGLAVRTVVIYHQDFPVREIRQRGLDRNWISRYCKAHAEAKHTAETRSTLNCDSATHQRHQASDDRETQAGAAVAARG